MKRTGAIRTTGVLILLAAGPGALAQNVTPEDGPSRAQAVRETWDITARAGRRVRIEGRSWTAAEFEQHLTELFEQATAEFDTAFRPPVAELESSAPRVEAPIPVVAVSWIADRTAARAAARASVGLELRHVAVLSEAPTLRAVVHLDPVLRADEQQLRALVGYLAGRLLLMRSLEASPAAAGHGWLEAGVAHWLERKLGGSNRLLGYGETVLRPQYDLDRGDWLDGVRERQKSGDLRPLSQLLAKQHETMDFEDHATALALVQELVAANRGQQLLDVAAKILDGAEPEEALRTALPDGATDLDSWLHDAIQGE